MSQGSGHFDPDCEVARGVGWMCTCRTVEEKAEERAEREAIDAEDYGTDTGNRPADVMYAARLLAKSLTNEMIQSVRNDWGNTNAAVLVHWRDKILSLLGVKEI